MSSSAPLIRSITIYGGLPLFACGVFGNLLNVRGLWRIRNNPCGFIFIVASFFNCFALFYGLFTRILSVGFGLDWSSTNLTWCKNRTAFTQTFFLMSLSCICLASVDRMFSSCREQKFRKFSQLSVSRWAVIITITLCACDSIPYLVYANITSSSATGAPSCRIVSNKAFVFYLTYIALPVNLGLLPNGILLLSGLITYNNINKLQMNRQRQVTQKQLTLGMLIQIPIIVISTLPYVIFSEYVLLTATISKSDNQRNVESIISNIFVLLFYVPFACQVFVFLVSSPSFRDDTKRFLLCHHNIKTNQVQPCTTTVLKTNRNS